MRGTYSACGNLKIAYAFTVGKPEGKRSLGRPRCRWKDDIKMALV